jgi:hypothetical protein
MPTRAFRQAGGSGLANPAWNPQLEAVEDSFSVSAAGKVTGC